MRVRLKDQLRSVRFHCTWMCRCREGPGWPGAARHLHQSSTPAFAGVYFQIFPIGDRSAGRNLQVGDDGVGTGVPVSILVCGDLVAFPVVAVQGMDERLHELDA